MARIIEPLRSMGAAVYARRSDTLPPLVVIGSSRLSAVTGLIASGSTTVDRADSAAVSYQSFFVELERLRA